jgi:hypothetical protein
MDSLGADPQTARHYTDAAKVFDRSEILRKASALLLPQNLTEGPEK